MITCTSVSKSYGSGQHAVPVLRGVSLDLPKGSFTALMGVSGSGKSTLIRILAGLESADEGQVTVAGRELSALKPRQRSAIRLEAVGVVFQEHLLLPELSAVENVELPLRGRGFSRAEARKDALEGLEFFGLAELADRFPDEISGGQKQRVGIARALVGGRTVILADEPTGALDRGSARVVFETFRRAADEGVTVLVATHDPLVGDWADATVHLVDGEVEAA
ncbi:ABC transporter ATP-binding protein [Falsarthrobacter nasiphocae]|uniref:ABC transport system ATP-binding protein n=1 Tax=Falsarthrobacter nasiphocae TaxID=189863 RepID=A0AAE3YG66_9MICC|nr:ABC transporter ATP-binding protein [Falsarthrobacter nasiphocae]MDR6891559.1 putative ABC transport system ATP-binding protein [Falsarthrobacter nasiphocae]